LKSRASVIWKQQRERAAEKVKKTGAAEPMRFTHFEDALASRAVEAVLISTPDHQHCTAALGGDSRREKRLCGEGSCDEHG
jgi:predicted dehydrogenase